MTKDSRGVYRRSVAATQTHQVISLAKKEDMYASANTFDRARKAANIEAIPPARLESVLGNRYQEISEDDRKRHWVRLGDAPEPRVEEWRSDSSA